jgi:tRNA A-37 threonylcarbamoyl transferase component Bud32
MMNDLIGTTLGPYQILEQLGQGGMATVFKAYQPAMDRFVAIKVLPRHMASDPQFRARFQREARTIARLEHRYILPVYDSGEQDGIHYMVMRYTDGGTLSDLVAGKSLTVERAAQLIAQVADALGYAHRQGVIHRDIKPANVLISREGDALLSDFGIARIIEGTLQLTSEGMLIGTPFYMAPEQVQGRPSDARTDIYALGVVLYETVTGRRPYEAETPLAVALMHVHNPLPPPRQIRPDLPEALERIILRALAKSPEDRFQTADEMGLALQQMGGGQTTPTRPLVPETVVISAQGTTLQQPPSTLPPATPPPAAPAGGSRRWMIAGLIGVVLIVALSGAFLLGSRQSQPGQRILDRDLRRTEDARRVAQAPTEVPAAPADAAPAEPASEAPTEEAAAEAPTEETAAEAAPAVTDDPLMTADGVRFTDSVIRGIVSSGDSIWAVSQYGLAIWDGEQPLYLTEDEGLPFTDIRTIYADQDGQVWLAGYEDVALISRSDDQIEVIESFDPGDLGLDYVSAMLRDSDGQMLAGGYLPSGLVSYDGGEWKRFEPAIQDADLGEISGTVYTIHRSGAGDLWLATEIGLLRLHDGSWQRYGEEQGIGAGPIRALAEKDGALWVAAVDQGLLRYDVEADAWERVAISADVAVLSIAALPDGSMVASSWDLVAQSQDSGESWETIGTTDGGDIRYAPGSLHADSAGRIWVGGEQGLTRYADGGWEIP